MGNWHGYNSAMRLVDTAMRLRIRQRGEHFAEQAQALHQRFARIFWMAHSAWALFTGIVVLVLAHNRYGFLKWVVLFLALTWASTLVISRYASFFATPKMRFAKGFVSYLTRVMYQETLFFLLPFYFYSTTFPSWNSAFVVVLAGLAVLSCYDLVFDRLLRKHKAFALGFFAVVTFSALQFFLPLLLKVRVHEAGYLAAVASFAAAIPLAYSWRDLLSFKVVARLLLALLVAVGGVRLVRPAIPPVPLRLTKLRFAPLIDTTTLRLAKELPARISTAELGAGRLYVVATIFSPARLPASVSIRFVHDGQASRPNRTVDLIAHERGFRVWSVLRAGVRGFTPGLYWAEVWTGEGQLIGRESIELVAGSSASLPIDQH